jgi:hypothetical protein
MAVCSKEKNVHAPTMAGRPGGITGLVVTPVDRKIYKRTIIISIVKLMLVFAVLGFETRELLLNKRCDSLLINVKSNSCNELFE